VIPEEREDRTIAPTRCTAGPGRVLRFPDSASAVGDARDAQKGQLYSSLTGPQKMNRIMSVVLSDELAEEIVDAILSRIEQISVSN
jgi:hypothetical protein